MIIFAGYGFAGAPLHRDATRPEHCGNNVRVESAALAERTRRQDPAAPAQAGHALGVVRQCADDPCDARAVPRTVSDRAPAQWPQGSFGSRHPVAGIGRIRIPAIAIVGVVAIADEIEPREQPSAGRRGQQVRVVVANARVEIRDDDALAAGRQVPGSDGVHRAWRGRRLLQVPLPGKQRVVRERMREAPLVRLGELDVGVCTQQFESLLHDLLRGRHRHFEHLQRRSKLSCPLEWNTCPSRQRRHLLRGERLRRHFRAGRGRDRRVPEPDDDAVRGGRGTQYRLDRSWVELRSNARGPRAQRKHRIRDQDKRAHTAAGVVRGRRGC